MEQNFYSRATGKLAKTSRQSYSTQQNKKKDSSTIYSVEDEDEDFKQYPMGSLTPTQKKYIELFLRALTANTSLEIDSDIRGIHWIGAWTLDGGKMTMSCTISQPHITNSKISLPGISLSDATKYSKIHFPSTDFGQPYITKTVKYCATMGKFAIPFADKLIEDGAIHKDKVSWDMVILSKTQPVFSIVSGDKAYECRMTHASCKVICDCCPESTNISHPLITGHNFAFRCSSLTGGGGTGPSITIHTSGTLQYQGKPESCGMVSSSFRDCIFSVMDSVYAMRFLKSLAIVRDMSNLQLHVQ